MSLLLEGRNIFIIEDDAENLAVISSILRRQGATIKFDRWGQNMVKTLKASGDIDIILCDLMLPGDASGYDALEAIRADPQFETVPIVAVTASDPDVELEKARDAGFTGFISKPVHRRRFPVQVLAILNGNDVWADDPYGT